MQELKGLLVQSLRAYLYDRGFRLLDDFGRRLGKEE